MYKNILWNEVFKIKGVNINFCWIRGNFVNVIKRFVYVK